MTGDVGSLFLLAWVKKQETPVLAINHHRQGLQCIILHSRTGEATIHAWQSPPPQKKFLFFLKIYRWTAKLALSPLPSPSPVLVYHQDVCLRGIDEQQFRRGQHCMEPLPSPEKRLAHGTLSFSTIR